MGQENGTENNYSAPHRCQDMKGWRVQGGVRIDTTQGGIASLAGLHCTTRETEAE